MCGSTHIEVVMGSLNSTHDQMCIGFTIKLPVWDISITTFLVILRMFYDAHYLVMIICDKYK